jgi:AmmeMemoRadiSam system protein B
MSTTLLTGRLPAHAGTFYPADRDELADRVDGLLEDALARLPPVASSVVRGVLVPHASFASSGAVAAAGWAMIGAIQPSTLVLLGTDHADLAPGVAVWTDGPWSGPLGDVAIDHGLADRIAALGPPFRIDDVAHRGEHSIEVQMPFLSRTCPETRIVPLLIGSPGPGTARIAGAWLGRLLASLRGGGERVVLVVSCDLTHDVPVTGVRDADRRPAAILALDAEGRGRRDRVPDDEHCGRQRPVSWLPSRAPWWRSMRWARRASSPKPPRPTGMTPEDAAPRATRPSPSSAETRARSPPMAAMNPATGQDRTKRRIAARRTLRTPRPLPVGRLYRRCPVADVPFATTATSPEVTAIIGQERAIEAIELAITSAGVGFNVFALRPPGIGKATALRQYLAAGHRTTPVRRLVLRPRLRGPAAAARAATARRDRRRAPGGDGAAVPGTRRRDPRGLRER